TSNASSANSGKEEASDNRSDYAKSNVEKETLSGLVDDLAPDKPGDQAEYDPAYDRHVITFPPTPLLPSACSCSLKRHRQTRSQRCFSFLAARIPEAAVSRSHI